MYKINKSDSGNAKCFLPKRRGGKRKVIVDTMIAMGVGDTFDVPLEGRPPKIVQSAINQSKYVVEWQGYGERTYRTTHVPEEGVIRVMRLN